MTRVWTQFLGVLALLVVGHGVYTNAYFMDYEHNLGNTLSARALDGVLTGDGFQAAVCTLGDAVETGLQFTNQAAREFTYQLSVEALGGDLAFCDTFELTVSRNGADIYTGSIEAFTLPPQQLASGASDTYTLTAALPADAPKLAGSSCQFDTSFAAYLTPLTPGEGFSDVETMTHTIDSVTPGYGGGPVDIDVSNTATVTNAVRVVANSGGNSASGGDGGDGTTGSAGGDGGSGGNVSTGDATATATIKTELNSNEVTTTSCGCLTCGNTCTTTSSEPSQTTATASPETRRVVRLEIVSSTEKEDAADDEPASETASGTPAENGDDAIEPTIIEEETPSDTTSNATPARDVVRKRASTTAERSLERR